MEIVHRQRVSHNTIIKPSRTWWQDALIKEVAQMTISPYIDVRRYPCYYLSSLIQRASQGVLFHIVRRFKSWASLVLPILIPALRSKDMDTVKGALHTLRVSTLEHTLARHWEFTDHYILALFEAFNNFDRVFSRLVSLNIALCPISLLKCNYFNRTVQKAEGMGVRRRRIHLRVYST
jgi:hypothetical protein